MTNPAHFRLKSRMDAATQFLRQDSLLPGPHRRPGRHQGVRAHLCHTLRTPDAHSLRRHIRQAGTPSKRKVVDLVTCL